MTEYRSKLYMVKGVFNQDDTEPIIKGYYFEDENKRNFIMCNGKNYETNPYTVCKNTGIVIGNNYVYENDVIQYNPILSKKLEFGYIEYSDIRKCYVVVTGIEQRGTKQLGDCCNIKLTGKNIILSEKDYEWFRQWEKKEYEKSKSHVIDSSYCPSKFKK